MKYNFDEAINRRNTNSVKWDFFPEDVLPMWVADMDFKIAPEIQKALSEKSASGLMGYQFTGVEFKTSAINWMQKYHQFQIKEENILPVPGVLVGISAIITTFFCEADKVILQPPVYDHFFETVKNSGAELLCNDLIYDENSYKINFEDFEEKAKDPKTKFLIFCNPHNPVGKVWTENDLRKIAQIASQNGIIVISDEIHSDLVFSGYKHIPFAKIAKDYNLISFTLASPCKTFNLSGLSSGYIVSENFTELLMIQKTLQKQETEWLNPFCSAAFIAAYNSGHRWMEAVKEYLYENYLLAETFIKENITEVHVVPSESTYLIWIDCKKLNQSSNVLEKRLIAESKLKLNSGTRYGAAGEGFLRMNIACRKEILLDGLTRLRSFVNNQRK